MRKIIKKNKNQLILLNNIVRTKYFFWLRKGFLRFYILSLIYIYFFCSLHCNVFAAPLLKGGVSEVVEKGANVEINLSTPLNFYFSQEDDKVSGFIKEDIYVNNELYIPKGSRIDGVITNIKEPKTFGRNGSFEIDFHEIVTQENVKIPIHVSVSTDKDSRSEKIADILTYDAALVAYGGIHGFIAGLQYGGVPLAVASHGISLLASTGIGAGAGLIGSAVRKGKIPIVLNNINIPFELKSNFYVFGDLPHIKQDEENKEIEKEYKGFRFHPALNKEEIKLEISKINKEHSKVYGSYILLDLKLKNNSQGTISLSDLVLVNDQSGEELHADLILSGTEALKNVSPFEEITARLAYLVSDRTEKYALAVIDPLDREQIIRIPLKDNEKRDD